MARRSATLKTETSYGIFHTFKIWVYEIIESDIFPVKFEYKARGYKGLRFSERSCKIKFD